MEGCRGERIKELTMRNLINIIDQIIEVAPDLKDRFISLRSSTCYTAPELMGTRWNQAADILNSHALNHPQRERIDKIFSGTETIGEGRE